MAAIPWAWLTWCPNLTPCLARTTSIPQCVCNAQSALTFVPLHTTTAWARLINRIRLSMPFLGKIAITAQQRRCGKWNLFFQFFESSNALVEYMLDGTAIKEAIEHGKNLNGVKDCESIYPGCPLNKDQTLNIIGKLLPGGGKQWMWWKPKKNGARVDNGVE